MPDFLQLYESKKTTDNKLDELAGYQDELTENVRKMTMSLCYNNEAFLLFVKTGSN